MLKGCSGRPSLRIGGQLDESTFMINTCISSIQCSMNFAMKIKKEMFSIPVLSKEATWIQSYCLKSHYLGLCFLEMSPTLFLLINTSDGEEY